MLKFKVGSVLAGNISYLDSLLVLEVSQGEYTCASEASVPHSFSEEWNLLESYFYLYTDVFCEEV